jgi:hypothetical protein
LTLTDLFRLTPKSLKSSRRSSNGIWKSVAKRALGETVQFFNQKLLSNIPSELVKDVAVFLVYVLLTFVMTLPMSAQLGKQAAGQGNDMWVSHWNNWWLQKILSEGHNLYHTPYMFYPQGTSLVWHSFSWFNATLWLLFQSLIGSLAAHSITILSSYVMSAYTAYLLARELTGSRKSAFVAGVIFAFYPYRLVHRNQIKLLSVQWIPIFALYLMRTTQKGRLLDGLKTGVALALCGLCGAQLMILSAIWAGVWLPYNLITKRENWSRRTVWALLLSGVVSITLLAPFFAPLVLALLDPSAAENLAAGHVGKATDLLAYFVPNRYHPLHPVRIDILKGIYRQIVHVRGDVASIGYVTLGLVIWALIKHWDKTKFWFFAALFFAILTFGPTLHVNGLAILPMPYRLLKNTILGKAMRHPSRFNLILALPIAMLASIGFKALLDKLQPQRQMTFGFIALCVILILFEYFSPFDATEPLRSAFYEQLRKEEDKFAVADFPIGFHAHDKWYMYAQTLHEHPMIGGHISRVPEHAHDFINRVPLLKRARKFAPQEGTLTDVSRQLEPLAEAQVKYVLIHKYRARPGEEDGWREWFAIQPCYEDQHLVAFRTAPQYGQDFHFIGEIGDGIGVISATLSTHALAQEGVLEAEVVWGTKEAPSQEWTAYLALVDENGQEAQRTTFQPCSSWSTSKWEPDAIARGKGTLQVDPFVERGAYTVAIGLTNAETGRQAGEPVAVGKVNVQAIERVFEVPEMEFESGAVFGDVLKFLGYDMQKSTDQLKLTLHWQALQRMKESYKFFVHLVDVESGQVVAQADVIPYDWTYPTIWWKDGEIVSDEITLSLQNIDLQDCQLEIGVYHANSGERLLLTKDPTQQSLFDRLILPKTNVEQ